MTRELLAALAFIASALLITAGVSLIFVPAGLIAAGVCVIGLTVLLVLELGGEQ